MITQPGCRKGARLKKFVLEAHPLIQTYIQKLKIPELIGTYIQQDHRLKLSIEQTLGVLIHNILSSPLPMYEIADWAGALDERCLGLDPAEAAFLHDDRVGQALDCFYRGRHRDVFFHLAHSQIKTWQEVTPVLLKKAERVIAYLRLHVMALMVGTLMERQLRRAIKRCSLSPLPLYPEDRPCPYPTIFDIVRAFRGVERYEVLEGERLTLFPAQLSRLQKQILELLEVPIALYQ